MTQTARITHAVMDRYEASQKDCRDLATWSDYPHALTLKPGPNTSTLPSEAPQAIRGAVYGLIGEFAIVAAWLVGSWMWHHLGPVDTGIIIAAVVVAAVLRRKHA